MVLANLGDGDGAVIVAGENEAAVILVERGALSVLRAEPPSYVAVGIEAGDRDGFAKAVEMEIGEALNGDTHDEMVDIGVEAVNGGGAVLGRDDISVGGRGVGDGNGNGNGGGFERGIGGGVRLEEVLTGADGGVEIGMEGGIGGGGEEGGERGG